jgi:hypothetical protein
MKRLSWHGQRGKFLPLFALLQLAAFITMAQLKITGKVTGPDGAPLPSISVQLANSGIGASTNADGAYSIDVPREGKYTVNFTGVGYRTETRPVNISTASVTIDVQLADDALMLNDVIVTGNAVATSKKKLANAVSTVSARDSHFSA